MQVPTMLRIAWLAADVVGTAAILLGALAVSHALDRRRRDRRHKRQLTLLSLVRSRRPGLGDITDGDTRSKSRR